MNDGAACELGRWGHGLDWGVVCGKEMKNMRLQRETKGRAGKPHNLGHQTHKPHSLKTNTRSTDMVN